MADPLAGLRRSWNPLRVEGTALPPALLLMAKLVVFGLVLKNYHVGFPDVFAPFVPALEAFPAPFYRRGLMVVFALCAGGLLLNRAVRTNCLILGALFLIATLSSKVYYRNAKVFVGLMLFLTGLQHRDRSPYLLWWQLAVVYFGAGLNKLLEADWRSGVYFEHFLTEFYPSRIYAALAPRLPERGLALMLSWGTIVLELGAAALFLVRRLHPWAVALAAQVHVGAMLLVAGDYGIFLVAILASYLACALWPRHRELVVVAAPRGWVKRVFGPLDVDRTLRWETPSDPAPGLVVRLGTRRWSASRAFLQLLFWTPTFHFLAVTLLGIFRAAPRGHAVRGFGILAQLLLFGFLVQAMRTRLRRSPDGALTP